MASRQMLLLATVAAAACLAPLASAMEWKVGDDGGWRAKFNQTGWADGKTFRVGDSLLFTYPKENHTVIEVGKEDFAGCNLQGNQLGAWYSGNDTVKLEKPGNRWFICNKPNHCNLGMKLVISVFQDGAPAPAPTPPGSSSAPVSYTAGGVVAAAASAVVAAALAF